MSQRVLGSAQNFDDFIVGFNQSAPLFSIIDAGEGKETADAKIREMLNVFTSFPHVKKVYLGGSHDGGYATDLRALETKGLRDKICLLEGAKPIAWEIERLGLRKLPTGHLFQNDQDQTSNRSSWSPTHRRAMSNSSNPNWRASPTQSPVMGSSPLPTSPPRSGSRQSMSKFPHQGIAAKYDPIKPSSDHTKSLSPSQSIHGHDPKPCVYYYVQANGCPYSMQCNFDHTYFFTEFQIEQYRKELKSIPCKKMNERGHNRSDCVYDHSGTANAIGSPTPSVADLDPAFVASQDYLPNVFEDTPITSAAASPRSDALVLAPIDDLYKGSIEMTIGSLDPKAPPIDHAENDEYRL